jgi:hypothetical protein
MVSGYILQAVGVYQSNTGDTRYNKPGSMVFEIDNNHKYAYDLPKIAQSSIIGMRMITVSFPASPTGSILPSSKLDLAPAPTIYL